MSHAAYPWQAAVERALRYQPRAARHDADFVESDHPRAPAGTPEGGQFASRTKTLASSKVAWGTSQKGNATLAAAALTKAGFLAVTENPSGRPTNPRFAAIGSPTNGVLINRRCKFWKNPVAEMKRSFDLGFLSTPDPMGVLFHEIAHTEYPDVPAYWPAASQKEIAGKVSTYAKTNPREFVSETFAGLQTGREYPEDVMRIYRMFIREPQPESAKLPTPESQPKLPAGSRKPEARERYKQIKELVQKIDDINSFSWKPELKDATLSHFPMRELQSALNDLWDTRMHESGKLSPADRKLANTLQNEVSRRLREARLEREERARDFAYMSDEELNETIKKRPTVPHDLEFFGGDSRMKPGMKAQLARLPQTHILSMARNGIKIRAVKEIAPMAPDHPYAPNMQPAGVFRPRTGEVEVADQISLPDGSVRILEQRAATLRHEIGHAIDDITGTSDHVDLGALFDKAVAKMTPAERSAAAYWVGDTTRDLARVNRTRRSEMFAETYAYAYDDDDEDYVSFGGLSKRRLAELLGPARKLIREKLAAYFGDTRLDAQRARLDAADPHGFRFGYRIYDGSDGKLHFDQIVDGRVYPLQPTEADAERQRGYYGPDFTYLGETEPEEQPPARQARADADQPSAESAAKMPPGPARAAGILLLHRSPEGDRVLFVRHAERGTWEFPGGHLEEDETPEVAAEREVLEELGVGPNDYGPLSLMLHNSLGGTDFSTFIAHVPKQLEPELADGELADWQWASPESPPEPLHPGARVALERLHMHELDLARAIASGEFSSPQQYENVWLFAVRVTGTGASYREELNEHVWRPPELYLNADFLARCAGLPVIIQHPETDELTTEEYADRVIGGITFAYIEGDEVWGIARIYDQNAAKLMRERQLSTSPAVVFRDPNVNETRRLSNGKTLFIEGEPSLLDHLAICEAGVWDKGGAPTGVAIG